MKHFEETKKRLNGVEITESERWIEDALKILTSTIAAHGAVFIKEPDIVQLFGEECLELSPRHLDCLKGECTTEILESLKEIERREIASVLYCPIMDIGSQKCLGVALFWGRAAYDNVIEEMVPLRSGGETIGVTVKKRTEHMPARVFDYDALSVVVESFVYLYEKGRKKEERREEARNEADVDDGPSLLDGEEPAEVDRKKSLGLLDTIKKILMPKKEK